LRRKPRGIIHFLDSASAPAAFYDISVHQVCFCNTGKVTILILKFMKTGELKCCDVSVVKMDKAYTYNMNAANVKLYS